jgi:hypothetical protein
LNEGKKRPAFPSDISDTACQKRQKTVRHGWPWWRIRPTLHPNCHPSTAGSASARGPPSPSQVQNVTGKNLEQVTNMKSYEEQVDRLFANAEDRHDKRERTNPVTGGRFVPGLDPIGTQKREAIMALKARDWFETQRPPDAPKLPLTYWDREDLKVDGIRYIVSLFARSLAMRDYHTDGHPHFEEYTRGVMASGMAPEWVSKDPDLLRRYPPKHLRGLGGGCIWRPIQ